MVEILKEKKIINDIIIPKKLITPEIVTDVYNPLLISDFSRTQTKYSFSYVLGAEIIKDYFGKKEYNNMLKKIFPLTKNALMYLLRSGLNLESQKLKTLYSVFNGVDIDIVKKTAKNIELNPYFKDVVRDIREYNNLDNGDYFRMRFISRDLKLFIENYVELNEEFNDLGIHVDDILANEMDKKNDKLIGEPRIFIKSNNKYDLLDGIKEVNPDRTIVHMTDNDENLKELEYLIRVQKVFGI